jgi:alkylation response protein AidB-like acyl-CoA dehydrogenase
MQLELNEDQALLCGSLDQLLKKYQTAPVDQAVYALHSPELQRELAESGFLAVGDEEGYGPLAAALVVETLARSPYAAEAGATALVAPALGRELAGPMALCEGLGRPTRYLATARHAVLEFDGKLLFADLDPDEAESVDSVVAYPLGVLRRLPHHYVVLDERLAATVRRLGRTALAAEAAGLMRAALDLTVAHVKDRRQFGHPLGDFQAIQHRLAVDEQIVSASYMLAMRAAASGDPGDAATAALYVQEHMRKIIYDCHQFTGAMGLTLEYALHLWTYRLKFIQGELGGRAAQAEAAAEHAFA